MRSTTLVRALSNPSFPGSVGLFSSLKTQARVPGRTAGEEINGLQWRYIFPRLDIGFEAKHNGRTATRARCPAFFGTEVFRVLVVIKCRLGRGVNFHFRTWSTERSSLFDQFVPEPHLHRAHSGRAVFLLLGRILSPESVSIEGECIKCWAMWTMSGKRRRHERGHRPQPPFASRR